MTTKTEISEYDQWTIRYLRQSGVEPSLVERVTRLAEEAAALNNPPKSSVFITEGAVEAMARSIQPTAGNHDPKCPVWADLTPLDSCNCGVKSHVYGTARRGLLVALPLLAVEVKS